MVVTADVTGVIIAGFGFAATLLGGTAGLLARQSRKLETRFGARFDHIEGRLDRVESEIVELKVAVPRIEGPRTRLLRP
jgi:hypothetical protein